MHNISTWACMESSSDVRTSAVSTGQNLLDTHVPYIYKSPLSLDQYTDICSKAKQSIAGGKQLCGCVSVSVCMCIQHPFALCNCDEGIKKSSFPCLARPHSLAENWIA